MKCSRALILFLVALPVAAQNHYYTTTFPATENPVCEDSGSGCVWLSGKADGVSWGDVQTTPGLAFATIVNGNPPYDDSTAVLKGTWTSNQTVQATVYRNLNPNDTSQEEVELRLNTTITPNNISGYELDYGIAGYAVLVRWNGPLNNFTYLTNIIYVPALQNGDILMGTNVNGVITLYRNGVKIQSVTDTTYTGGSPGVGFWNLGGTVSELSTYGFSKFTAWDSAYTGKQPSAPTGLTGTVVTK
jgi:hypothetical protein